MVSNSSLLSIHGDFSGTVLLNAFSSALAGHTRVTIIVSLCGTRNRSAEVCVLSLLAVTRVWSSRKGDQTCCKRVFDYTVVHSW